MIGVRNPKAARAVEMARAGKSARTIAAILDVDPKWVSNTCTYARRVGALQPVSREPAKTSTELSARLRYFGLPGIGKFGPAVTDLPPDVLDWLIGKSTPTKTLTDVACDLIIAAYDAEKVKRGT